VEFLLLYLIRTYDVETLLFWLDVEQYRPQTNSLDLKRYADRYRPLSLILTLSPSHSHTLYAVPFVLLHLSFNSIWTKYLDDAAELTIRDQLKETTVAKIENDMLLEQGPPNTVFDDAQKEVYQQMSITAFSSFLKSYECKSMLKRIRK
jgi:hypothetical protein